MGLPALALNRRKRGRRRVSELTGRRPGRDGVEDHLAWSTRRHQERPRSRAVRERTGTVPEVSSTPCEGGPKRELGRSRNPLRFAYGPLRKCDRWVWGSGGAKATERPISALAAWRIWYSCVSKMALENPTLRRSEVLRILDLHGARNSRIFGSVARGDARPASDIDVLVEMDSERTLVDLVALEQDLTALFGRRVDVVTDGGISPHLRERILAEAVPL